MKCPLLFGEQKIGKKNRSSNSIQRARFRRLAVGLIFLVAFVVLAGGLQYGQAEDALLIDPEGTVKVKRLDVESTAVANKYVGDGSDLTVKTEMGDLTLKDAMALIKQVLDKVVPIGTIMAYGGDVRKAEVVKQLASQGWLVCDGMQVKREDYPALFQAVGVSFGAGDGKTTFHLPDMRGRFLRGVDVEDANRANWRDPDHDTRVTSAGGGNTGNQVGSVQDDALQEHLHSTTAINGDSSRSTSMGGLSWRIADRHQAGVGPVIRSPGVKVSNVETRPKNTYVHWIIKARPAM